MPQFESRPRARFVVRDKLTDNWTEFMMAQQYKQLSRIYFVKVDHLKRSMYKIPIQGGMRLYIVSIKISKLLPSFYI